MSPSFEPPCGSGPGSIAGSLSDVRDVPDLGIGLGLLYAFPKLPILFDPAIEGVLVNACVCVGRAARIADLERLKKSARHFGLVDHSSGHYSTRLALLPVACSQRAIQTSMYSGDISAPIKRRPIFSAAIRLIPLPRNGSKTVSPSLP